MERLPKQESLGNVRDIFPALKYVVYLDTANQCPPGMHWISAIRESLKLYEVGILGDGLPCGELPHIIRAEVFGNAVEKSARLLHAFEDEVTLNPRVMASANLIINDVLTWSKGDNVVFTDLDYPSIPFILAGLRRKIGVELRRIRNRGGLIPIDELERSIDDRTKLVVINHTMPWSGYTYPDNVVKEISEVAHEHGAYVLDDAFQAVGAIDIDVHKLGIDFLLTGAFKWQCGPEGAGILYVRKELIEELDPRFRNYFWAEFGDEIPFNRPDHDNLISWDYPLVKNANRFEMGVNVTPILYGWDAALGLLLDISVAVIEDRVRKLGQYLYDKLMGLGVKVMTPEDRAFRHGLIVYTSGDVSRDKRAYETFNTPVAGDKPVKVSLRYVGGVGGIRVSTHFFNTKEEIDYLIERTKKILSS